MKTGTEALAEFNTKDVRHVTAFVGDNAKNIDVENHRINFVVSASTIDRDYELVEASAVIEAIKRKGQFKDNPVCLQCHQHKIGDGSPPAIGQWDVSTARKRNNKVEMVLQFDTDYDLGEKYWTVYRNRTMRAVSIGFRVLEHHEERRGDKRVWVFTKIELFEISCVAVGCNQEALSKLKGLGLVEDEAGRSGKRKRGFVESKVVCKRLEDDVDYFVKQLEKWDSTPPELRCDAFDDGEIKYFTKLDKDAEEFADALSGENEAGIYNPVDDHEKIIADVAADAVRHEPKEGTIAYAVKHRDEQLSEVFGSVKMYRRYKEWRTCEGAGREVKRMFSQEEIKIFNAFDKGGLRSAVDAVNCAYGNDETQESLKPAFDSCMNLVSKDN